MFSELDPLMSFACPHCGVSLRWRWLKREGEHLRCAQCRGALREHRHPALFNPWLWSRFYLPGVFVTALGLFVPSLGWLLPWGVVTLGLGLLALVVYMVRERWGWQRYVAVDDDAPAR